MSDVLSTYDKYEEMACDTYCDFLDEMGEMIAKNSGDGEANIVQFRTARVNAFLYWNGETTNTGLTGSGGDSASGDGGGVLSKAKKMEQRLERLKQAKKDLMEASIDD